MAVFDKTTGALSSAFAPTVNGDVNAVLPGPTTTTVYIGGAFTQVNGVAAQFVALLDTTNGSLVTTFHAPAFNWGFVNDMVLRGGRLYVAGTFTTVGGKAHGGLASLNPTTGALDPFMNVQFAGHHNDSGSGAQGWVGPSDIDVTPNGATMVVIGNFKTANGLLRDQVALLDLTGASAQVAPWATSRVLAVLLQLGLRQLRARRVLLPRRLLLRHQRHRRRQRHLVRHDRPLRDQRSATPTPSRPGSTRPAATPSGASTVTDTAVYIGGHNRWINNPLGVRPAPAPARCRGPASPPSTRSVRRAVRLEPGPQPARRRGVRHARHRRPGCGSARTPTGSATTPTSGRSSPSSRYAGGYTRLDDAPPALPGTVYLGGSKSTAPTNVLYRVDAGGPAIAVARQRPGLGGRQQRPEPVPQQRQQRGRLEPRRHHRRHRPGDARRPRSSTASGGRPVATTRRCSGRFPVAGRRRRCRSGSTSPTGTPARRARAAGVQRGDRRHHRAEPTTTSSPTSATSAAR